MDDDATYILGSSRAEQERLAAQARAIAGTSRRLLERVGIRPGMRVLDVGCGHGKVTSLIASLVGAHGRVMGLDRDARVLAVARDRIRDLGLSNVELVDGDMNQLGSEHGLFDAIVGRRVLMYQAHPVDAVRGMLSALRPGGLVVFQEQDTTMVPASLTPLPLHDQVQDWLWRTVEGEGADRHMGFHLRSVLRQAGLAVAEIRAEAIVQTPDTPDRLGMIVAAILPRIVEQGVATEAEIDVATLTRRLTRERQEADAVYIGDMVFGAWARKPAP